MKQKNKDIYLYGSASLLNDLSSDLASSALPFFILSLGGNASIVTFLLGIKEALPEIIKPFAGYASDRLGMKKPFVLLGYILSATSRVFLALSNSISEVLLAIGSDRLGKGIRDTPRDVLISFLDGRKGLLYGIHKSMDTLGALLGSLLGVYLAGFMLPREVLIVAAAIGLFSFIPLLWVKERKTKRISPKWKFSSKILPLALLAGTITNVGLPIALLSKSFQDSVLLYLVFNITYMVTSPLLGSVADKKGFKAVFLLGFLLAALSYGFMFWDIALGAMVAMGGVYAIIGGAGRSFISFLSRKSKEIGTEMGLLSAAVGAASLIGSSLAATLLELSPQALYGVFIALSIVSIASLRKV